MRLNRNNILSKKEDITMKKLNEDYKKRLEDIDMEKLTDEQLEMINGGSFVETADDSKYLKARGLIDDDFGDLYCMFNWGTASAKVDAGWAKVGVTCVTKYGEKNLYFYQGKQITRGEAHMLLG